MPAPTEAEIMKMKKDQLKEVILSNGFGSLYKSTLLKADLQVLALKSVGLGQDKPMPEAVSTGRTPRARKTISLSSPAKAAPATAPAKQQSTPPVQKTPDIDPISFPLPETPDGPIEEEEEAADGTTEPADKGSMDSKMWAMVDGAFIVMLVAIVISVFVAYALNDPAIKGEVVSQWETFKKAMLDRLAEAKEQMQFGEPPAETPEAY